MGNSYVSTLIVGSIILGLFSGILILLARASDVTDFSDENFPKEIEVISLTEHFFDMVGFRMPDGVVFLADCISSRETLDKYAVSFIYNVSAYLVTLDMVEGMEATMFVSAHAEASADIKELVRYNRDKVHEVVEKILSICKESMCFERILQEVFKGYISPRPCLKSNLLSVLSI